ncbi:sugar phosphate nucleotidyltransferase [Halomicrococcus sp. NG-SE-24]|uniref:sugar phosphate nucleotidyltransferase n=1 Tax=Halomicrococcus sp. NG-SE-24 TaxID=3436928 RepID=UPI003D990503
MQAVVLAAGEGTRLRPLTDEKPKVLVDIAGKPLLTRCFEALLTVDPEEFVVVAGYEGDRIVEQYGDSFSGVPVTYAWQDEREGMAHALLQARPHVDGRFVCADGDCVFEADLAPLVERARESGVDAVQHVERVPPEVAREKAICEVDGDELRGIEKEPDDPPERSLVAGGVAVYHPAIFAACEATDYSERGERELAESIQRFVDAGNTMLALTLDGWSTNVNTPEEREAAADRLRE